MLQTTNLICDEHPRPKTRSQLISESKFLKCVFKGYVSLYHLLKPTYKISKQHDQFTGELAVATCQPGAALGPPPAHRVPAPPLASHYEGPGHGAAGTHGGLGEK